MQCIESLMFANHCKFQRKKLSFEPLRLLTLPWLIVGKELLFLP